MKVSQAADFHLQYPPGQLHKKIFKRPDRGRRGIAEFTARYMLTGDKLPAGFQSISIWEPGDFLSVKPTCQEINGIVMLIFLTRFFYYQLSGNNLTIFSHFVTAHYAVPSIPLAMIFF